MSRLFRVLEIAPTSGNFCFGGGNPQTWLEVDWFTDEGAETIFGRPLTIDDVRSNVEQKRYIKPGKGYLVLCTDGEMTFTINYSRENARHD